MKELAHVSGSNGGFRPEEMHRREFQRTTFETLETVYFTHGTGVRCRLCCSKMLRRS